MFRDLSIWLAVGMAIIVPLAAAANSPFLAWRDAVYIIAGFAGIVALALLLVQPLLISGFLPGPRPLLARRLHRVLGGFLAAAVFVHVAGLWITSPPDVVDALLFASPTPFSVWGVIALWAVFATALLAATRQRLRLRPKTWRKAHGCLVILIVVGTVVHALQIEGTMETISKIMLCGLVLAGLLKVLINRQFWS